MPRTLLKRVWTGIWQYASRTALACSAGVVLAPVLYRAGIVGLAPAFLLLGVGFVLLLLINMAVLVSAVRTREFGGNHTAVSLVASALVASVPFWTILMARGAPAIHDITTDTADPPEFVGAASQNFSGRTVGGEGAIAMLQTAAYADIQPLILADSPDVVFRLALAAVKEKGWTVTMTDFDGHRIEATDTTFWFGFTDDIAIRVRGEGGGSRLDVRSRSRVGVGDMGTNARRIREYLLAIEDS